MQTMMTNSGGTPLRCPEKPRYSLPHRPRFASGEPTVTAVTIDGVNAVRVSLCGTHGQGREMVLTAEDWAQASAITPHWFGNRPRRGGKVYVVAGNRQAEAVSRSHAGGRALYLSRVLVQPETHQQVYMRDGNALNLLRSNLTVDRRGLKRDDTANAARVH